MLARGLGSRRPSEAGYDSIPIRTSTSLRSLSEALTLPIGIKSDVADVEEVRLDQVGESVLAVQRTDIGAVATLTESDGGHAEEAYHAEEHEESRWARSRQTGDRHCGRDLEDGFRRADDCTPVRGRKEIGTDSATVQDLNWWVLELEMKESLKAKLGIWA